jgi:RNA binding exosome subunit
MRLVHNIVVTVYSRPEDNEEVVLSGLKKLLPFDLDNEKIRIERTIADGFENRKIVIFRVLLDKVRHINALTNLLKENLDEGQKRLILKQKESRLDEHNHFFLRFDKDKLARENIFFLTDTGNCYHIKMSIAAFPTTRENALNVVEQLFS